MSSMTPILTLALMSSLTAVAAPDSVPPNIISILLDDAGWNDAGFSGNTYIETPNLDRLAKSGAIFTTAYATHAFCAPSRQSMMTGQWPARTAWMQRSEVSNPDSPQSAPPFAAAGTMSWSKRVPEFTSIAQALKTKGYATAHIGKSHVHFKLTMREMGFDYAFGDDNRVGAVKDFFAPYEGLPGNVQAPPGEYLTDRLTQETIGFIEANKERPIYVQLWHYAPHTPIQAPKEVVEKYRRKRAQLGDMSLNPTYAAMLDVVDQGVGRIVQTLEKLGLSENTAILFTSDNGGVSSLGSVPVTSMAPLRGHKGLTYEGGVRVPMFIHWPGKTAGTQSDAFVTIMDFYPTILELAGVPYPDQPQDGISLVPLMTDGDASAFQDRPLFWYNVTSGIEGNGETFQPVAAVRKGNWRLVKNFEKPLELYNLNADPGEALNLAGSHPKTAQEMERLLDDWLADTGVVTPTPNPRYDPDYVIPRQVDSLPEAYQLSKQWKLNSADCGWRPARMVKTSFVDGAMRLQADGVYPVISAKTEPGLAPGKYAVQVELRVPTCGRIRFSWASRGEVVEFFPQRDGQWHTLTGVFEAREPIRGLSFAAPTHLQVTGHYDPATQPDWIEVRSIRLFCPATTSEGTTPRSRVSP